MNLSTVLPPTPEQRRQTQSTIDVAERPIKELIFKYFELFKKSSGPIFHKHRKVYENIKKFSILPLHFVNRDSLYYLPEVSPGPSEEVMTKETKDKQFWEKWELQVSIVPDDYIWDEDGKISSLIDSEAVRINSVVGKLLHISQLSWQIIVSRYEETKILKLHMNSDNLTLSLEDPSSASKSDHLKIRLGINIIVKDKIEIDK